MSILIKNKKYNNLIKNLSKLDSCVIAFSGGVDSTFLAAVVKEAGIEYEALTIDTPFVSKREIEETKKIAEKLDLNHHILKIEISKLDKALKNNSDRCYHCKKLIFNQILDYAGGRNVVEGSNTNDTDDYRPGQKALKELGIKSPLLEASLSKKNIREFSKKMELPTWDKPSMSCLATRISYSNEINKRKLLKIENAEEILYKKGFKQFRVRNHNNIARIELSQADRKKILNLDLMDFFSRKLKELGFKYVTLDLTAYQSGSMNKEILED